jgi:hypothetical protein
MAKVRDLTPKNAVRPASEELKYEVTPGELPMADNWGGFQVFSQSFKRGFGSDIFGVDQNGFWMGAAEFADAPFSVDYQGNMIATSATFSQYVTKTGTGQVLSGSVDVGAASGTAGVFIDGANKRIIINDGTNDRILIGYQSGGF